MYFRFCWVDDAMFSTITSEPWTLSTRVDYARPAGAESTVRGNKFLKTVTDGEVCYSRLDCLVGNIFSNIENKIYSKY